MICTYLKKGISLSIFYSDESTDTSTDEDYSPDKENLQNNNPTRPVHNDNKATSIEDTDSSTELSESEVEVKEEEIQKTTNVQAKSRSKQLKY